MHCNPYLSSIVGVHRLSSVVCLNLMHGRVWKLGQVWKLVCRLSDGVHRLSSVVCLNLMHGHVWTLRQAGVES